MTTKQVSIKDFLLTDVSELTETKEIQFPQFKFPFIVKSLSANEFNSLRRQATKKIRSKTGQIIADTDQEKFNDILIAKAVTQPELDNAELQEFYGTVGDPAGTARSMLKAGQFADLQIAITEINGFDDEENIEELGEELKK